MCYIDPPGRQKERRRQKVRYVHAEAVKNAPRRRGAPFARPSSRVCVFRRRRVAR